METKFNRLFFIGIIIASLAIILVSTSTIPNNSVTVIQSGDRVSTIPINGIEIVTGGDNNE